MAGKEITILGANGRYGQMLAYLIKQLPLKSLKLFDIDTVHQAQELEIVNPDCKVRCFKGKEGIGEAIKGADVIVVNDNYESEILGQASVCLKVPLMTEYASKIASHNPMAVIVVAAPPVNFTVPLLSALLEKLGKLEPNKMLGVTNVDCLHASSVFAAHLGVSPTRVFVPVVGGSSLETRVPLFSKARPKMHLNKRVQQKLIAEAKMAAEGKRRVEATSGLVSSILAGLEGREGVVETAFTRTDLVRGSKYFSLPILLGRAGIKKRISLPSNLPQYEEGLLQHAVNTLAKETSEAVSLLGNVTLDEVNVPNTNNKFSILTSDKMEEEKDPETPKENQNIPKFVNKAQQNKTDNEKHLQKILQTTKVFNNTILNFSKHTTPPANSQHDIPLGTSSIGPFPKEQYLNEHFEDINCNEKYKKSKYFGVNSDSMGQIDVNQLPVMNRHEKETPNTSITSTGTTVMCKDSNDPIDYFSSTRSNTTHDSKETYNNNLIDHNSKDRTENLSMNDKNMESKEVYKDQENNKLHNMNRISVTTNHDKSFIMKSQGNLISSIIISNDKTANTPSKGNIISKNQVNPNKEDSINGNTGNCPVMPFKGKEEQEKEILTVEKASKNGLIETRTPESTEPGDKIIDFMPNSVLQKRRTNDTNRISQKTLAIDFLKGSPWHTTEETSNVKKLKLTTAKTESDNSEVTENIKLSQVEFMNTESCRGNIGEISTPNTSIEEPKETQGINHFESTPYMTKYKDVYHKEIFNSTVNVPLNQKTNIAHFLKRSMLSGKTFKTHRENENNHLPLKETFKCMSSGSLGKKIDTRTRSPTKQKHKHRGEDMRYPLRENKQTNEGVAPFGSHEGPTANILKRSNFAKVKLQQLKVSKPSEEPLTQKLKEQQRKLIFTLKNNTSFSRNDTIINTIPAPNKTIPNYHKKVDRINSPAPPRATTVSTEQVDKTLFKAVAKEDPKCELIHEADSKDKAMKPNLNEQKITNTIKSEESLKVTEPREETIKACDLEGHLAKDIKPLDAKTEESAGPKDISAAEMSNDSEVISVEGITTINLQSSKIESCNDVNQREDKEKEKLLLLPAPVLK